MKNAKKAKKFKVEITYSIDSYARKFKRKNSCEAYLCWKIRDGESEMIVGRGKTFAEARARVIEIFRKLPPSEILEIEK